MPPSWALGTSTLLSWRNSLPSSAFCARFWHNIPTFFQGQPSRQHWREWQAHHWVMEPSWDWRQAALFRGQNGHSPRGSINGVKRQHLAVCELPCVEGQRGCGWWCNPELNRVLTTAQVCCFSSGQRTPWGKISTMLYMKNGLKHGLKATDPTIVQPCLLHLWHPAIHRRVLH